MTTLKQPKAKKIPKKIKQNGSIKNKRLNNKLKSKEMIELNTNKTRIKLQMTTIVGIWRFWTRAAKLRDKQISITKYRFYW